MVTVTQNFRSGPDYIITHINGWRALMRDYRSPSSLSSLCTFRATFWVSLGLAQDYLTVSGLGSPEFTRFSPRCYQRGLRLYVREVRDDNWHKEFYIYLILFLLSPSFWYILDLKY